MNTNNLDLVESLSSLYDLSLSFGDSFDTNEISIGFLKGLRKQLDLSFLALYKLIDQQDMECLCSMPDLDDKKISISNSFFNFISSSKHFIVDNKSSYFNEIQQNFQEKCSEYCFYFVGDNKLFVMGRNHTPFSLIELKKYNLVINKFSTFMESIALSQTNEKDLIARIQLLEEKNQKLNNKNTELLKYINSKNELENFTFRTSHDLKAPLRTIIAFTELLKNGEENNLNSGQLEIIDFILKGGNQMNSLIDSISEYSRTNSNPVKRQKIEIRELINDVLNLLNGEISKTNANIDVKDLPKYIFADLAKMKQLFFNLLSNALKFSRKEINPEIEIYGIENNAEYLFSIKDNGIGMEKEYTDKIFDLFEKLNPERYYNGSGIGLSTSKQIVLQHGGNIWLDTEPNAGSTFYFTVSKS